MKNRRLEFRCTDEEFDAFQALAEKQQTSVSEVIRGLLEAFGSTTDGWVAGVPEMTPESPAALEDNPHVSPEERTKAFKQLVAQLQARMPKDEAEDEARKRLTS